MKTAAFVIIGILAGGVAGLMIGASKKTAPLSFGPQAVSWHDSYFEGLQKNCGDADTNESSCATAFLESQHASDASIDFFRRTHWFITRFREFGVVDLGEVVTPWRANTNDDYLLLNGSPEFVSVESSPPLDGDLETDKSYAPLKEKFKDLTVNPGDETFESVERSKGTISFIFQYELADLCHACGVGHWARQAFDFKPDGTFLFSRFVNICRGPKTEFDEQPVDVGAPACPAPG